MTPNFRILLNVVQMNFGREAADALKDLQAAFHDVTRSDATVFDEFDRFESAINNHK